MPDQDVEMLRILQQLLDEDINITAREVARHHPTLKAASSITRNAIRNNLLSDYQNRQLSYRRFATKIGRIHPSVAHEVVARYEGKIRELEKNVQILTASHIGMIRALGAAGGFRKWAEFFEPHREIQDELNKLGAMPDTAIDTSMQRRKKR